MSKLVDDKRLCRKIGRVSQISKGLKLVEATQVLTSVSGQYPNIGA